MDPSKTNETGDKRKGWATPFGFFDFAEPVTYEEALKAADELKSKLFGDMKG